MNKIQLSQTAESDIALIADYTIYKFGITHARKYRDGLLDTFSLLAENPSLGRIFKLQGPVLLKRYQYRSHVVFYAETDTGILIVRILGGMMDFEKHL